MKWDIAQLGARMHYAVPEFFSESGFLNQFYTDLWFDNGLTPLVSTFPGFSRLKNRINRKIPNHKVHAQTLLGLKYALQLKQNRANRERETQIFLETSKQFQSTIIRKKDVDINLIYAFNSVAKDLFKSDKYRDAFKVLEQTLVPRKYENQLLDIERGKWRYQKKTLSKSNAEYEELELEEAHFADLIVVGSQFVKHSLIELGIDTNKIEVIPYGFTPLNAESKKNTSDDVLRVVFIGNGGLRKGLQYALPALADQENIVFTIVGGLEEDLKSEYANCAHFDFKGRVERDQIVGILNQHDVLLLPSICEGSATVSYEALSCGLPVIATPNSGTVIRHLVDGYIIPIRSKDAIKEAINYYLSNPNELISQKEKALKTSKMFTKEEYGNKLLDLLKSKLS